MPELNKGDRYVKVSLEFSALVSARHQDAR